MNPAVIGVFVPIILFLVIGLIAVSSGYFQYRVRQTLVDKGLDAQQIKDFLEHKKDPNTLMKIGIIAIAFGIGLGLGMALQDYYDKDYWVPFSLFVFTGIGFVIANIVGRKLDPKKNQQ